MHKKSEKIRFIFVKTGVPPEGETPAARPLFFHVYL